MDVVAADAAGAVREDVMVVVMVVMLVMVVALMRVE